MPPAEQLKRWSRKGSSAARRSHSPIGHAPKVTGKQMAQRLFALEGRVVYLVDCLFENSVAFIDRLRQWFADNMPPSAELRRPTSAAWPTFSTPPRLMSV